MMAAALATCFLCLKSATAPRARKDCELSPLIRNAKFALPTDWKHQGFWN
jgi:hypothetical protein